MKKRKLVNKLLVGMLIATLLLVLSTGIVISIEYTKWELEELTDIAYDYAMMASEYIDGDRVSGYLETLKKDDYYYKIEDYLNHVQINSKMLYYYVFKPCEDDVVYIWDATTNGDYCELGQREDYLSGGKEACEDVLSLNGTKKLLYSNEEPYGNMGSAYYPLFDSNDKVVALVGVDYSMNRIIDNLIKFLVTLILTIISVTLVFFLFQFEYTKKKIIDPLEKLNDAAEKMVSNLEKEETISIDINTDDEIEQLSDSFVQMNKEVREYIGKLAVITAEKERIGAELNVATQIQADMLPRIFPPFPDRCEFDLFASMHPAKEVGGDFYDFFMIDNDHLALVMADVSGKGVPAALFMTISKTLIKNRALMGGTPSEILTDVNSQLCEGNESEMFVTVWLCIVEISTGKCIASNAGHEYPAIRRGDGKYELYKQKHSPAMATMEGLCFRQYEFELFPGDSIYVYTDGVPEASNSESKLFGTDRMLDALNKAPFEAPENILENVHHGIDEFVADAPQFDDITMLCLHYYGKDGKENA